jgi:hypothetical protein
MRRLGSGDLIRQRLVPGAALLIITALLGGAGVLVALALGLGFGLPLLVVVRRRRPPAATLGLLLLDALGMGALLAFL